LPTNNIINEVEEALARPKVLDRDLVRDLVTYTKAVEQALADSCRTILELEAADQGVVEGSNALRESVESLLLAFNKSVEIADAEVDDLVDEQIKRAQNALNEWSD